MIGPRLGFPRKKYVQRKPSPTTLIRHAFTNQATGNLQLPSGVVATAGGQQMNTLMPQPAGHQNIQHHQGQTEQKGWRNTQWLNQAKGWVGQKDFKLWQKSNRKVWQAV